MVDNNESVSPDNNIQNYSEDISSLELSEFQELIRGVATNAYQEGENLGKSKVATKAIYQNYFFWIVIFILFLFFSFLLNNDKPVLSQIFSGLSSELFAAMALLTYLDLRRNRNITYVWFYHFIFFWMFFYGIIYRSLIEYGVLVAYSGKYSAFVDLVQAFSTSVAIDFIGFSLFFYLIQYYFDKWLAVRKK